MSTYNIVASMEEATVVAEYTPSYGDRPTKYQSEADLEKDFIRLLCEQGYEYLTIRNEQDLILNLRVQLERLNKIIFTDGDAEMPEVPMDAIWIVFGQEEIRPMGGRVIRITPEHINELMVKKQ